MPPTAIAQVLAFYDELYAITGNYAYRARAEDLTETARGREAVELGTRTTSARRRAAAVSTSGSVRPNSAEFDTAVLTCDDSPHPDHPQAGRTTEMPAAVPGTGSEFEAVADAEGNDAWLRLLLDSQGYVTCDMLTEVEAGQRSKVLAEYATRNRLTDSAILIGEQLVRPVLGDLEPGPSTEAATDRSQSSEPGATVQLASRACDGRATEPDAGG